MGRNALGKGLNALIREREQQEQQVSDSGGGLAARQEVAERDRVPGDSLPRPEEEFESTGDRYNRELEASRAQPQLREGSHAEGARSVDVDLIDPSPYQPRTDFRAEALNELARSLRASGVIQPVVLRPNGTRYQLVAGERRWRAAQIAGLQRVPAVVRDVPPELALEITLVENIQREDLNPIDQARAFERLMDQLGLTQEQVAERTGKDRAVVANSLRLLNLDERYQVMIRESKLSAGHGRALLAVADERLRRRLAWRASRGGLTVRQIERIVARQARAATKGPEAPLDANVKAAIEELERHLGTRVRLRPRKKGRPGLLSLEYYDDAQLQRLYERLLG